MKVSRTVRSGGKGGKWSQSSTQTLPIAMPFASKRKMDIQDLREMVADINEREVTPEERLSDNVYEYSAATKEIVIAGNDPRQKESVEHIR